ncbi:MAG: outer membrane beta-barrel protein [Bacteroidetes bacterium]|jgi:hypothetical protein|nr:outer membrane beta-barrel protein [Bacteroidota bacterium]
MNDEHNIDRLFQESFKDFEVDAPQSAWRGIEKRLNQKSKRRVIPIWQKVGGVAAIIAIVIMVGSQWFLAPNQINENPVVDQTQQNSPIIKNDNEVKGIVTTSPDDNLNQTNDLHLSDQNKILDTKTVKSSAQNQNQDDKLNPLLASNQDDNSVNSSQKDKVTKNISTSKVEENPAFTSVLSSKALIQSDNNIKAALIEITSQNNSLLQKKSLVEVAKTLKQKKQPNLNQAENKSWFVKPQISPIFYGNLASGSAVDPNLASNDGQGEFNMSYGVNVAYQLNDKIKLRTGVNRVNLNYTTKNVYLIPNQALSNLRNVNTNPNFNATVLGRQQLDNLSANGTVNRTETIPSQLQQELGYIEIPMEVEYKILNRAIDINLIGGASTLLLNNNSLDVKNSNGITSVGEANNINNLSFSTNFAIGFDYNISKRVMFNLEPTFKYQLNTFQSRTTGFQPYFLGVYSGLIFKF